MIITLRILCLSVINWLKLFLKYNFIIIFLLLLAAKISKGNNACYITLSNQIARRVELEVITNNLANANTSGFEQSFVLFNTKNYSQGNNRKNSFVNVSSVYRDKTQGAIKRTNVPTDVAIVGEGYFQVITPRGLRYTIDGSMVINNEGELVNWAGYKYTNREGGAIVIPEEFNSLQIAQDGIVFVDNEEIDTIGVFTFDNDRLLTPEEGMLYYNKNQPVIPLEEYKLVTGALRAANVNSTAAMLQMVAMQRSVQSTNQLMSEIFTMDKSIIKIGKN